MPFSAAEFNRPFPSSPGPLFQNEGKCSAFDKEIIFHSHANKIRFHKKGCAPSLILKVRVLQLGSGLFQFCYCLCITFIPLSEINQEFGNINDPMAKNHGHLSPRCGMRLSSYQQRIQYGGQKACFPRRLHTAS